MVVRAGAVVMLGVALALASPAVAGAANPAPEVSVSPLGSVRR